MRRETIDPAESSKRAVRWWVPISVLGMSLVLTACSDTSLVDLGGRSSDWIGEAESENVVRPAAVPVDAPEILVWANDDLGVPSATACSDMVMPSRATRPTSASSGLS